MAGINWRHVIRTGLLMGLVVLVASAIGMVEAFDERDLVVGYLTLGQLLLFAPALFAGYHRGSAYPLRGALIRAVVVGIVALATVSPWTYRNYQVFGTFILVSTNGGMTMLTGNNPSVVGDYGRNFSEDDPLVKAARFSVAD